MCIDIFYFSGTGNSLFAARQLNGVLSGNVRLMPIKNYTEYEKVEVNSDCLIIVFPVYFQTIPRIVKSFVRKLEFTRSSVAIYGVATCNGGPGHSLFTLGRILKKNGKALKAGFTIDMPGNSLIGYDFTNPPEIRIQRLKDSYDKIAEISYYINNKRSGKIDGYDGFKYHLKGLITGTFAKNIYKTPKRFRTLENCTKCKSCIKVCPINNISMGKEGIQWGSNCEHCLACFHWCPGLAIELGNTTKGKLRYHHPDILIKDMYDKSHYDR